MEIVWNIPNFGTFPQRQWLRIDNRLVGNEIIFETDDGPDLKPVKFLMKVYTADVLERASYNVCYCLKIYFWDTSCRRELQ